jgi:outer membrane protein TolC
VRESKANLEVTSANEDIVRQNIMFEVQQAYFNLREADERIPAAELVLRRGSREPGDRQQEIRNRCGSPIEVTDAAVAYINARTSFVQALTDYKTAGASLERAMGERDGEMRRNKRGC